MLRFVKRYFWIGFLFALSCDKPKAPSFIANLQIPLFNKNYTYLDMKVNHDSLHVRGDSVFAFIDTTENFKVEDNLKANPTSTRTAGTIKNDLRVRDSVTTNYSLGVLAPGPVDALHGTNAIIPPFAVPNTTRNVNYPTFTSTTIYSGTLRTVVTNNTRAKMDSLFVVIFNSSNGARIDSFKISNLVDATTQTFISSFASPLNVITPVSIRLNGGSGSGSSVAVDTSRSVSVKVVFDIAASSITGLFAAQTIVRNDSAQSTSNSQIDSAVIKSGKIDFKVTRKSLAVNSTVTITSTDFRKPNGSPLDTFITMPSSGTSLTKSLNLSGYKFRPTGYDVGSGKQYARYTATIVMAAPGVSTTIANDQGDTIVASIDTLKFARVDGKLNNENVTISPRTKNIDIKNLDSIQILTAYLQITTEHRIQFPTDLTLNLSGTRNSSTVSLPPIHGSLKPYTGGANPQRDTIYSATGVAALISLLPQSLNFSGNAVVGVGGTTRGTILGTDSVIVRISLRAPLIFKLPNDTTKNVIEPDSSEIGISRSNKQRLRERLEGVTITARIQNHFPVPVSFQIIIDSLKAGIPFYKSTSGYRFVYPYTPLVINKGTTDANGIVTAANDTTITYILAPSEYERLFNPNVAIYRGMKARLLGTGGFVQISSQDYLDVDATIDVEFFVDKDIINNPLDTLSIP